MPHIEIGAEKLFEIFGLPVTNTLLMSWIVIGILLIASLFIFRRMSIVPSFLQNILEFFVEGFLKVLEGVFGTREKSEKYFPIVATIFLFVLISNWLGILPGVGSLGFFSAEGGSASGGERIFVPFFRSSASDLNFTLALAIVAVVLVHILGVAAIGAGKHISKFFTFKSPIDFFVGILEFISEIAKMISFSFRLFGNVFAGEVLLVITAFLVPYLIPVPFLMLEIFVGFIQALVFAMLTTVFISIAISHNH
ncbi:MAG: F0F1 ATP synthase subunit A [Candidatus Sungbacteria bacterium]|nr:F0F1 ATP synthase subunit A [Candidatus Sungbacteria bacterium]